MIKKGIIAWIVSGVFVNLWSLLTCCWLFRWVYFVEPTNIYGKNKTMVGGLGSILSLFIR